MVNTETEEVEILNVALEAPELIVTVAGNVNPDKLEVKLITWLLGANLSK